jgi:hypothetical protein
VLVRRSGELVKAEIRGCQGWGFSRGEGGGGRGSSPLLQPDLGVAIALRREFNAQFGTTVFFSISVILTYENGFFDLPRFFNHRDLKPYY